MRVGLLVLELYLPGAASLKDKRRVVRSLVERTRGRHNVAAAEVEYQDLLQRAGLAFVSIASTDDPLNRLFDQIMREAEEISPGVAEISREILG